MIFKNVFSKISNELKKNKNIVTEQNTIKRHINENETKEITKHNNPAMIFETDKNSHYLSNFPKRLSRLRLNSNELTGFKHKKQQLTSPVHNKQIEISQISNLKKSETDKSSLDLSKIETENVSRMNQKETQSKLQNLKIHKNKIDKQEKLTLINLSQNLKLSKVRSISQSSFSEKSDIKNKATIETIEVDLKNKISRKLSLVQKNEKIKKKNKPKISKSTQKFKSQVNEFYQNEFSILNKEIYDECKSGQFSQEKDLNIEIDEHPIAHKSIGKNQFCKKENSSVIESRSNQFGSTKNLKKSIYNSKFDELQSKHQVDKESNYCESEYISPKISINNQLIKNCTFDDKTIHLPLIDYNNQIQTSFVSECQPTQTISNSFEFIDITESNKIDNSKRLARRKKAQFDSHIKSILERQKKTITNSEINAKNTRNTKFIFKRAA